MEVGIERQTEERRWRLEEVERRRRRPDRDSGISEWRLQRTNCNQSIYALIARTTALGVWRLAFLPECASAQVKKCHVWQVLRLPQKLVASSRVARHDPDSPRAPWFTRVRIPIAAQ